MGYTKNDNTDWIAKEKRELFCKAVNSMLMTTPEKPLEVALNASKTIVDKAFENYPDNNGDSKTQELPL